MLTRYHWPGNVRELQNVLKRALAMCRQATLSVEDLPDEIVVAAGEKPESDNLGLLPRPGAANHRLRKGLPGEPPPGVGGRRFAGRP